MKHSLIDGETEREKETDEGKMDNVGLREKECSQTMLIKSLCFFASLNFSLSKMMDMILCPG